MKFFAKHLIVKLKLSLRYEKRFEFGLQEDKKEQKIYPQSVNSACKQYCEH